MSHASAQRVLGFRKRFGAAARPAQPSSAVHHFGPALSSEQKPMETDTARMLRYETPVRVNGSRAICQRFLFPRPTRCARRTVLYGNYGAQCEDITIQLLTIGRYATKAVHRSPFRRPSTGPQKANTDISPCAVHVKHGESPKLHVAQCMRKVRRSQIQSKKHHENAAQSIRRRRKDRESHGRAEPCAATIQPMDATLRPSKIPRVASAQSRADVGDGTTPNPGVPDQTMRSRLPRARHRRTPGARGCPTCALPSSLAGDVEPA
ncbi:hypothetical protein A0H81_04177 [Grifola frondosa]|uniref:Uncharacterized protein n=1 Tax=Grifola frondosa TaxID=5627 RepID=A0A1C7MHJ1_GRIFR|nr:hypothetical protein A0H81_04177 [Grifola frondosa]